MTKILTILGPTATGKSDLAVECALRFNGEVISADSRQIYKGLDIGTGKITFPEMRGVPHHLLDICQPNEIFTAKDWKDSAEKKIDEIVSRNKLPIICGGTGFYIPSLLSDIDFPDVQSDPEEHARLESMTAEELMDILRGIDSKRAETIDKNNKRRIARSIIIARALGKVPELKADSNKYDLLKIGLKLDNDKLRIRIKERLGRRIQAGMIDEARELHKQGLSLERMENLGLEYRYLSRHISGKISENEMIKELETKIWQYAKRQMTWFKRDKEIVWIDANDTKPVFEIIEKWKIR